MCVDLLDVITPSFYELHQDILENKHTHYWLKGGRGSTKSSFASLEIIWGIMNDPNSNGVILRKYGKFLRGSVYEQLLWAIDILDVEDDWKAKLSPLELIYLPTGQKIIFRGVDIPRKIKSTKFKEGYCKFIWFEELEEFKGMDEIRSINQSLLRGGEKFVVIYSYNPPKSANNWINAEILEEQERRIIHHSSYLDVPVDWLGEEFMLEAQYLKKSKPELYEHEYLGKVTGTGGQIFENVTIDDIDDLEILKFDRICEGIDWGYAVDPFVWVRVHYDATRRLLFVFDEIYKVGLSNRKAWEMILQKKRFEGTIVYADSSEPKSIAELKEYGINIRSVKKGSGSIEFGMKFLTGEIEKIIIDNKRCPNVAREFINYEFERDSNMEFKSNYPDKNNHTIDAIRYSLENYMLRFKTKGRVYVPGI